MEHSFRIPFAHIEETVSTYFEYRTAIEKGYRFSARANWNSKNRDKTPRILDGDILVQDNSHRHDTVCVEHPGGVVNFSITRDGEYTAIHCFAITESRAEEIIAAYKLEYPVTKMDYNVEAPVCRVSFWVNGVNGAMSYPRDIAVADWVKIKTNYTKHVQNELDPLMSPDYIPTGGQLLLWRGMPGTGKTWAIRSLLWKWREWAHAFYISDPDAFFGSSPGYMFNVLLNNEDLTTEEDKKWKIIILEDTGELISSDARARSGQGLSRLLNVVDGMLGQGLKVLVLITTNEELDKLDPAARRPGRCFSNIEFSSLSREETKEWAVAQGVELPVTGASYSLAELYAIKSGITINPETKQPLGFINF